MTLHCWQHWFWITGVIPVILLVLASLRPSSASAAPWEPPPSVWTSTAWLQSGPAGAPPTWAIQRRLLGFAMPQAPTAAVPTPVIEALVYTLSPPVGVDVDVQVPDVASVPSATDAQTKSSHTVNTTSSPTPPPTTPAPPPTQKSPPSKQTRPKVFKTYVASMPKTSMAVKPAKLSTSTSTPAPTTTAAPVVTTTNSSSSTSTTSIPSTEPFETSTEDVIADPPPELMNDGPADASVASEKVSAAASPEPMTPGSGPSAGAVSEAPPSVSSSSLSPTPSSSKTSTSSATIPVPTEAPHRREQSRDLEIIHPGVSFDNVSKQHALSSNESYGHGSLDAGSITGIAFGVVLFAALVGSASFVLYRRRFLNKPQTLNDKCSNPDSSGYIDDSTLRENSEEMYSLDNDSFLNSLEAMTIQNYWTDSVKHTKL